MYCIEEKYFEYGPRIHKTHWMYKFRSDEFSWRWCTCSENPICSPPCLSGVFPVLPLKQFQCLSNDGSLSLSRKIIKHFLWPRLTPPGDMQSVSQAPQHFRSEMQATCLHYLPVFLLSHFASLWHIQGRTFTGISEGRCWILTHMPFWASRSTFHFL